LIHRLILGLWGRRSSAGAGPVGTRLGLKRRAGRAHAPGRAKSSSRVHNFGAAKGKLLLPRWLIAPSALLRDASAPSLNPASPTLRMNPPPAAPAKAPGKPERIRLRILGPLIVAIALLLTTFGLGIHWEQQRANERSIRRASDSVRRLLHDQELERVETMRMTLQQLLNDDRLAEAFAKQDRAALLERTQPLFANLKRIYHIKHFGFISPNRTNVLRVHSPEQSGGSIPGELLLEAERTGQTAAGLQQGPQGEFVLRVAAHWRRGDQLLGYVELGVNFEDIIRSIHDQLDVELLVALDKTAVRRDHWEQAWREAGQPAHWDQFPFAVVVDRTLNRIPEPAQIYLRQDRKKAGRTDAVLHWKGGVTQVAFLPLEYNGAKLPGEIIVLRDISAAFAETREAVWVMALICAGVSAGLVAFFYAFLGRIERKLADRTAALQAEITERQAAQQALREANERLEERVAQRTAELQKANAELQAEVQRRKQAQEELLDAQQRLLEISRQAGMAEVATAVLHNVGNVLNSVNISSSVLTTRIRQSRVASLSKATELLQEHANDLPGFFAHDPKAKHLPPFIKALAAHLAQEQKDLLAELQSLSCNIEHINEIVAMQQNYAKVIGVTEQVAAATLFEDALRVTGAGLTRRKIEVQREFAEAPLVTVDKHKVLQILVNLIRNADRACAESSRPDKRLTLRVSGAAGRVQLSVSDNGVGIPAENLTRIFQYGFSTHKDGHGFGLHSGALAAKELGGALTVRSDGPGQGAVFTLELPCQGPEQKA
jgi:signal transduction histidine kinase